MQMTMHQLQTIPRSISACGREAQLHKRPASPLPQRVMLKSRPSFGRSRWFVDVSLCHVDSSSIMTALLPQITYQMVRHSSSASRITIVSAAKMGFSSNPPQERLGRSGDSHDPATFKGLRRRANRARAIRSTKMVLSSVFLAPPMIVHRLGRFLSPHVCGIVPDPLIRGSEG